MAQLNKLQQLKTNLSGLIAETPEYCAEGIIPLQYYYGFNGSGKIELIETEEQLEKALLGQEKEFIEYILSRKF